MVHQRTLNSRRSLLRVIPISVLLAAVWSASAANAGSSSTSSRSAVHVVGSSSSIIRTTRIGYGYDGDHRGPYLNRLLAIRGGGSQTPSPPPPNSNANYYPEDPPSRQQSSQQTTSDPASYYRSTSPGAPGAEEGGQYQQQYQQQQQPFQYPGEDNDDNEDPFHETVQDRVDNWRRTQMEKQQRAEAEAAQAAGGGGTVPVSQLSSRDEQGRLKLLTSVSRGSRALIFFVLMFRDIHLYELADKNFRGMKRLLLVTPMVILFIGNLAGVVASFTSPTHSGKKRLKAILNLDKLREALLILFYLVRMTIYPSKYTPREIYVSNTLHSVFFILQCQAFTKLSWDDTAPKPIIGGSPTVETTYQQNPTAAGQGQQQQRYQQQSPQGGWYDSRPSR